MTKKNHKFALNLLALLIFCLFISLGIWQLHRAQTKRLLLNDFSKHASLNYLHIQDLDKPELDLKAIRYAPIRIEGIYDNAHVFLLDNKFYNHRLGYEVLTPFFPKGKSKCILVNQGWIPRNQINDQKPPTIPKIMGEQNIHGLVYVPLEKPFLLKQMPELKNKNWPFVIQALQIEYIEKQLEQNFYPVVVWLDKQEKNGFIRDWRPLVMLPQQHIAYAVQWFALALTLLIICIVLNRRK